MKYYDLYPKSDALIEKHLSKKLGVEPLIHDHCYVVDSYLGPWTELGRGTMVIESRFGDYSYTAGDVDMIYTEVGKFCSIASHVRINPGNHPMHRVTQHHMTYRRRMFGMAEEDDQAFFDWRRADRCVVGHDVWIGHSAILMAGVKVGTGAVIGAGAVVTKDIGDYEIAVGVPARSIRKRFSDDVIAKLLAIAWWDWDDDTLRARFDDLLDVPTFIEKYG